MSGHYEKVLEELRKKAKKLASEYVNKLYYILLNEKQYSPDDSRIKIIHDCSDIWTKRTIERYLPQEAKNVTKRKAGMISAQVRQKEKDAKLLVAVGGDVSLTSVDENSKKNKDNSVEMNSTENVSDKQKEQESRLEAVDKSSSYGVKPTPTSIIRETLGEVKEDPLIVVFSLQADDVLDHLMEHHYLGVQKEYQLWINGSIHKETGKVISAFIACHTANQ
jgi:hypothetical protein